MFPISVDGEKDISSEAIVIEPSRSNAGTYVCFSLRNASQIQRSAPGRITDQRDIHRALFRSQAHSRRSEHHCRHYLVAHVFDKLRA